MAIAKVQKRAKATALVKGEKPLFQVTPALVFFAKSVDAKVRMDILRRLSQDLLLLTQDEMRLRRSRKATASIDLAVISGQILGLRQAIDAITHLTPDWTHMEREAAR